MARTSRKPKQESAPPPVAPISGATELIGNGPTQGKRMTERGLIAVELLATNGRSIASIAKAVGVDVKTFARMCERQPEISEAIELGRGALSDELYDIFMAQARRGSTTAAIWVDKTRAGNNESGPRSASPQVAIQIVLNDALSMEEYLKRLHQAAKVVEVQA